MKNIIIIFSLIFMVGCSNEISDTTNIKQTIDQFSESNLTNEYSKEQEIEPSIDKSKEAISISETKDGQNLDYLDKNVALKETDLDKSSNYLILIEDETQRESINEFKAYKESIGFRVIIKSVDSEIEYKEFTDASYEISTYLQQMDEALSLDYVLLVGDPYIKDKACPQNTGGIIPMKYLYFRSDNHNTRYNYDWYNYQDPSMSAFNTPTDIYYAFDYNWDFDQDGYAGEIDEIQKNNEKMKLRFSVGRIPFSDITQIETVLLNTIAFEKSQKEHSNALLGSGIIGYPENNIQPNVVDGAYYADIFSSNLKNAQIETVTLYEKSGLLPSQYESTYPLNANNFKEQLYNEYDLIYTYGHGGTMMYLWETDTNKNGYCEEISYYDILPELEKRLFTGLFFMDGCHTMRIEKDSELGEQLHIQDYMGSGMNCVSIATTRESVFNSAEPSPRLVDYMFKSKNLVVSTEFYHAIEQLLIKDMNPYEAYIYCYLGDPSIRLKP